MAVDILYTGKGLTPDVKLDGGKAMGRLSDFITRAEEIKYKAFKDNKDWFLKTQEVDPVAFLTTATQDASNRLVKEYNESSAKAVQEAGGFDKLSGEAQSKILAGKNYLISEQNKMATEMQQYLLEREIVTKDKGVNYDPQEFYEQKEAPYLNGNSYNRTPLQPRAKPIEEVLDGGITDITAYSEPDPNTPTRIKTIGASKKSVAPRMIDVIFTNEGVKRHALEEWAARSEEDKTTYLNDVNGDGLISEKERRQGNIISKSLENPIIKAYIDKHWGNFVDVKFTNKQREATGTGGFNSKEPVSVNNNKNNDFVIYKGRKSATKSFGTIENADWISLGQVPQPIGEPQLIDEIVDYSGGSPVRKKTRTVKDFQTDVKSEKPISLQARINLIAYLPKDDVILVEIAEDISPFRKGDKVPLPAEKYGDLLKRKPLNFDRESMIKQYGKIQSNTIKDGELNDL